MRAIKFRHLFRVLVSVAAVWTLYLVYRSSPPQADNAETGLKKEQHALQAQAQTRMMGELTFSLDAFHWPATKGVSGVLHWSQEITEERTIQLEVRVRQKYRPEFVALPRLVTVPPKSRQAEVASLLMGPEYEKFHDFLAKAALSENTDLELQIVAKIKGASGEEQVTLTPNVKVSRTPFPNSLSP